MRIFATPDADGVRVRAEGADTHWVWSELAARWQEAERHRPRWVWADTDELYPHLLELGLRAEQCHDLRMVHRVLAASARCTFDADPAWGRKVRGHKVTSAELGDYVERVVRNYVDGREPGERFTQWARRADEDALV